MTEEQREARREANRKAARKYREQFTKKIEYLENENYRLETENKFLSQQVANQTQGLVQENEHLRQQLANASHYQQQNESLMAEVDNLRQQISQMNLRIQQQQSPIPLHRMPVSMPSRPTLLTNNHGCQPIPNDEFVGPITPSRGMENYLL